MSKTGKIKHPIRRGVAKTPVVMQLEALECGAASLSMILAYYGKWIPLEQVRIDCGVSRDGSNAKNIALAAKNYGLDYKAFRYEPEELKKEGSFPCIAHWEFNHFIVVNGFRGGKVYINDPARGSISMPEKEFDEGFSGVALMFSPTENFQPSGKQKSMISYAVKRLSDARSALFFVTLTSIISALFGLIALGFSRFFLDELLSENNPQWGTAFLVGFGLLTILQIIISILNSIFTLRIDGKLSVAGSSSYMWKVLRLPMSFFSQRMAGDIHQRQFDNAEIAGNLVNTVAPLFLNGVMAVFYLVVMLRYSVVLTVIGLLSLVINILLSYLLSKKRVNLARAIVRDNGKLYSTTVSGIEMIETIKASGAENGFFEKWAGFQASVNSGNVKYKNNDLYLSILPNIISLLSSSLILVIGVYLVMYDQFTIGMVMAFQGMLQMFTEPVASFISAGQTIQEMRTDMERVEDVMNYPDDIGFSCQNLEENPSQKLSGKIEIKNLTFGYSKLAKPLIRDFSMTLEQGQSVAFVGSSGCGKSTLSKLISGLYQPWEGEILFDGKKITEIDRNVFKGSLSVIDQNIVLFEDTISNNIKMWDNSIEDFEVILAARDAQIHDDIVRRDDGYRCKLAENGKNFSGGQRQRLEIARVLAQDPTIVIMDEATSALDSKTEYDVVRSIKDRGVTTIIIAHRLSTIRDCDEIIVLDKGEVVERGTHDELYALNGYYTRLVTNE